MPRKHDSHTRDEALYLLQIHQNIHTVHELTGVPTRTLRHWRKQLAEKKYEDGNNPATNPFDEAIYRNNPATTPPTTTNHGNNSATTPTATTNHGNNPATNITPISKRRQKLADALLPPGREPPPIPDNGKTYPYPIEEDENIDLFAEFKQLRDTLMRHAQQLARDLNTHEDDISRRTLALSRILDRITQLDNIIPNYNPERVYRVEYLYNGMVHDVPPWITDDEDDDDPTNPAA